jgi:hypothetical protein
LHVRNAGNQDSVELKSGQIFSGTND